MLSMLTSITSITSITSLVAVGVTTGSVLLSLVLIGLLVGKELTTVDNGIDDRVRDSLNAAIVPLVFAFVALLVVQTVA